ncbi:MAG: helix-turn-helix transcriptional regulator [Bacteroidales bacterium]|nr:helix-turn-helix transcriptional regulator [Bacteroidales bacterium]MCF8404639.1 helix-turn-helix transcriptional regulator [Bacteroidales bacterium]
MVNRIKQILEKKQLSPSQFADEIDVKRSNISHILSGRNKPSIDLILKILTSYPDINSDWLLFGKKNVPENMGQLSIEDKPSDNSQVNLNLQSTKIASQNVRANKKNIETKISSGSEIEKILVFFEDNTYREFVPKK